MSQPVTDTQTTAITPNSMPGATPSASTDAPKDQPAATTSTDKTDVQPSTPAADQKPADGTETPATGLTTDERAELERLKAVRTEERIWEKRAKANIEKATKWDQFEASQRTAEENAAIAMREKDDRIKELETRDLRNTVSRDTGVPPELVVGSTEEAMRAAAKAAMDWKGPAAPASSAVPSSVVTSTDKVEGPKQITSRDELARMTPADRMQAYRDGRLSNLGAVPGPGDLRNLQHANAKK